MKILTVLLRESVRDLGIVGDVVQVRPGFARNYLIPNRLAVEATPENLKAMERRRQRYETQVAAHEADVSKRIALLGELLLVTREKADEKGTLYGSVSATVVARLLNDAGYAVVERDVRLDEPIKEVGTHEVPIHVHGEHYGSVRLLVETIT